MKRIKILFIIPFLLLMITSCSVYKKSVPSSPFITQINITMQDLEYLGEITGTSTQSYVLGIAYGGQKYHYAAVVLPGRILDIGINVKNRGFNNALYEALMQKPDADFIMPIASEVVSHRMFLGREETITVKAKAFKIRTK